MATLGCRKPETRNPGIDLSRAAGELRAADPVLARVMDAVGPCRLELKNTQTMFGALSEAIVYQQLTGKAAATIHARVCASISPARRALTPRGVLAASDEALRGAGLSRAKTAALRDLAGKVEARAIPTLAAVRTMTDDEIVESLTTVRGIGRWTAEMLLMFRLGRPDVLPVDDYGVRKGFAVAYKKRDLPSAKELERHGENWRPWRTVASWYMWRVLELKDF